MKTKLKFADPFNYAILKLQFINLLTKPDELIPFANYQNAKFNYPQLDVIADKLSEQELQHLVEKIQNLS